MSLIQKFSEHEDDLIRRFHRHPFFQRFSEMSEEQLRDYLTQKWTLSENFVPWYDRAINGLTDEEAKLVLKRIIQDETPTGAPSHREDLIADLEFIGIPRSQVLTTRPTKDTLKALHKINNLANYTKYTSHDLKVMAALRTAGEILVAEEYRHVVPELERRYRLTPEKSRFYAPHFYHDRKDSETGQHTHSFESVLERMISDEDKLSVAIESAENAFKVRTSFYDQFTSAPTKRKIVEVTGILVASIASIVLLAEILNQDIRKDYARFLNILEPEAREFYVDADKRLFTEYVETGNPKYLENIGTMQAAIEVWGEGP